MNIAAILTTLSSEIPFLRNRFHVKSIGIFGSLVHGDSTEQSDIDIVVEFESPIGFFDFIRLENYLSKVLGKRVDLISKKAIKPVLKEDILKEVIYA